MKKLLLIFTLCLTLNAEDVYLIESDAKAARVRNHEIYKSITPGWTTNRNVTLYLFSTVAPTNKLDTRVAFVIPPARTNLLTAAEKERIKTKSQIDKDGWFPQLQIP